MNSIAAWFNLTEGLAEWRASKPAIPPRPPVVPQYLALAAGVAAEPFVHRLIAHRPLDLSGMWEQILFGLLIALIVFPGVYRNAFDPERPIFVQLCAILASGIGWQSLFQAATQGRT